MDTLIRSSRFASIQEEFGLQTAAEAKKFIIELLEDERKQIDLCLGNDPLPHHVTQEALGLVGRFQTSQGFSESETYLALDEFAEIDDTFLGEAVSTKRAFLVKQIAAGDLSELVRFCAGTWLSDGLILARAINGSDQLKNAYSTHFDNISKAVAAELKYSAARVMEKARKIVEIATAVAGASEEAGRPIAVEARPLGEEDRDKN